MEDNLPAQAPIEPQAQMASQGQGQWNKYPRKPYPKRGHDGQKVFKRLLIPILKIRE